MPRNTKIQHVWTVLCRESVINAETNNISLLDTLESITVSFGEGTKVKKGNKISVPIMYELVTLWELTGSINGEVLVDMEYSLIDPVGNVLIFQPVNVKFPKNKNRIRYRQKFSGFPFTEPGRYLLQIKSKMADSDEYKITAEVPIEVKVK